MALFTEIPALTTADDLVSQFGAMPLTRFGPNALSQSATEADVLAFHDREDRLFELVDGILVEKTMGIFESYLTWRLMRSLGNFVDAHNLGIVLPPDGMMRLWPGRVRIPDISFIAWSRLPGRRVPRVAMSDVSPNLAVEVISPSNTRQEMRLKLADYFKAGVESCWYVYPREKEVHVFTAPDAVTVFATGQVLDGGAVLPGLSIDLAQLFAEGQATE